ncbi:MAG: DUF3307 domain-containing protein [Wenzhouxiangella sp.]
MEILLALVIAHLVGDFLAQRRAVIEGKRKARVLAFLEHGGWHLACLIGAWILFAPPGVDAGRIALAFAAIVASHLLVDWLKYRLGGQRELLAFVLDQAVHLVVVVLAAWWLAGRPDWASVIHDWWRSSAGGIGWVLVGYLVVTVACGWFNRLALASLLPAGERGGDGLARAGLYIGWLERFLMFSAFLVQAWAAIGLVLAAKSVFRFDSVRKQRQHAEYFVIGTLLSVSEVVALGLVYSWLSANGQPGGS